MATKTFYLTATTSAGWRTIDETPVTAANNTDGWVVSTGATLDSEYAVGVTRAATTFVGTTVPDGTLDTSLKDAFRSTNPITGDFAAASWTFTFVVRGVTQAGTQAGRIRFRILRAQADGSSATEITSGIQTCSAVTITTTGTDFTSSLTVAIPAATLSATEYLFIQLAWERTAAGGMTTTDVVWRTGSSASLGTRIVTSNYTPGVQAVTGNTIASGNTRNAPTVSADQSISGATLASGAVLRAATITQGSPLAFVRLATISEGSTDSHGFTTSAINTTGADLILLFVSTSDKTYTVGDNKGNTYSPCNQYVDSFNSRWTQFFYVQGLGIGGTGHTFFCTGTSIFPRLTVIAYSGSTSAPLDVWNGWTNGFGTSVQTGSVSPHVDNEVLVTALAIDDDGVGSHGSSVTVDSGFTIRVLGFDSNFGHNSAALADLIQTTKGAVNPTWAWATNNRNIGSAVTFRSAPAATALAVTTSCIGSYRTITFDTESSASNNGPLTLTYAHTVGDDPDRRLYVRVLTLAYSSFSGQVADVQFNGVWLTLVATYTYDDLFRPSTPHINVYLYALDSPAVGTHDVVIEVFSAQQASYISSNAVSYLGVAHTPLVGAQTAIFDSTGVVTTFAPSLSTLLDKAWVVAAIDNNDVLQVATSGCLYRSGSGGGSGLFDSDGLVTPPGLATFAVSSATPPHYWVGLMAAFAPVLLGTSQLFAPAVQGTIGFGATIASTLVLHAPVRVGDWSYLKSFTVDHTQVGGNVLTNFPLLIRVTDPDLRSIAYGGYVGTSQGYDLLPCADSGLATPLSYKLVYYDPTTGTVEMWVNIAALSYTADTVYYLAFGNAAVVADGSTFLFGPSIFMVYHFPNGTTLSGEDSNRYFDLTNHGAAAAAGIIDGAAAFSSPAFLAGWNQVINPPYSISVWVKPSARTVSPDFQTLVTRANNFYLVVDGSGHVVLTWQNADDSNTSLLTSTSVLPLDTWTYISCDVGPGAENIAINGVVEVSQGWTPGPAGTNSWIGIGGQLATGSAVALDSSYPRQFLGALDEVRIATSAFGLRRLAEYNNQKLSSTFLTWGSLTAITPGAIAVTTAAISSTALLFSPLVSSGATALAGATITSTASVTPPSVQPGAVTILGATRASTLQLFAPTLLPGPVTVVGATRASTVTLFAPTVAPGALTLVGATISSTALLFPLTIAVGPSALTGATIASTALVNAPSVAPGPVSVTGSTRPSTLQLFAPSVVAVAPTPVSLAFRASTLQLFAPSLTVTAPGAVTLAFLASTLQLRAPTLTVGPVLTGGATITSTLQLHAPSVARSISLAFLASTRQLHAPSVVPGAVTVTLGTIAPASQLFPPRVVQPGPVIKSCGGVLPIDSDLVRRRRRL